MSDSDQNARGAGASESSPLMREVPLPSCSTADQAPSPNPPTPDDPGQGYQETHAYRDQRDPSHTTRVRIITGCSIVIILFLMPYLAVNIYFSDLPAKINRLNEDTARMREQEHATMEEAKHLESERVALRGEHVRLEKERLAAESSTLRMEGERRALESTIRRLEQEESGLEKERQQLEAERLKLEKEHQLLEAERLSLEQQQQSLEEERCRLEKQQQQLETERLRLEKQQQLIEGERLRLEKEKRLLENERQLLVEQELKMEGERQALESTIRRSRQESLRLEKQQQLLEGERSRLEKEKLLLANERRSLEEQELALREERERWEKARDEHKIPQGAFWEAVLPAPNCLAYGQREYGGILRNIPAGRSEMDACMNMPVEIKGVTVRRPYRCQLTGGSMHGFWVVDWDQPDCKPWHKDFVNKGCTNWGSGHHRIEAEVVGINTKGWQDWRLICETTPMTWNHITYTSPAHCDDRGKKIAVWDVPADDC